LQRIEDDGRKSRNLKPGLWCLKRRHGDEDDQFRQVDTLLETTANHRLTASCNDRLNPQNKE
jgi:hypothetical protein